MIERKQKTTTRGQLQKGNLLGEGRLWETRETMDKKRIKGRRRTTSWHNTAKSSDSTSGGKCDVCAGKQRVLTWGDPSVGNDGGKSAEVVVVRGQAGGVRTPAQTRKPEILMSTKDRTEERSRTDVRIGRPAKPPTGGRRTKCLDGGGNRRHLETNLTGASPAQGCSASKPSRNRPVPSGTPGGVGPVAD
jgi:hypothetical protein